MKSILTILLLIYSLAGASQGLKLDKTAFLIGTLDDYMGHQQTFTPNSDSFYFELVDMYFQEEKDIAELTKLLFAKAYPDMRMENNGAPKGIKIYSPGLSKKINSYYTFKPSGSHTLKADTVFTGFLKEKSFTTHNEKVSFIAGVYLRNSINPSVLSMPNSPSKAKLSEALLKELGCRNVHYEIKKGFIPTGHIISYEAGEPLHTVFKMIDAYKAGMQTPDSFLRVFSN